MILPSSRRPDRSHLAQTRTYAEVAGGVEDEAVEERGWTTGGEHDCERACEGYPCAVERVVSWGSWRFRLMPTS
jgi:hypothetical protein